MIQKAPLCRENCISATHLHWSQVKLPFEVIQGHLFGLIKKDIINFGFISEDYKFTIWGKAVYDAQRLTLEHGSISHPQHNSIQYWLLVMVGLTKSTATPLTW